MATFGEVLAFDPEQIAEIFRVCDAQEQTCTELHRTLKGLGTLKTWKGDASEAADRAATRHRADLDTHSAESRKVALAARDCYQEGLELSRAAKAVQADAISNGFVIDPVTGTVTDPNPPDMKGWLPEDRKSYFDSVTNIQNRVKIVLARAERLDDNLAAVLDVASGVTPANAKGESPAFNPAARKANQMAAFRAAYGRDPTSENDWRMAEMVDPHSYDPKNKGVPPVISAVKIEPVPGQGVVSTGLFIPGEKVFSGYSLHKGDGRAFDSRFDSEDTRITYVIDYENGLVIARQNPSVDSTWGTVATGKPEAAVHQLDDGSVIIDYNASDPLAVPPSPYIGWTVNGQTIVTPGDGGARISGKVTNFPSMETYQYLPDGSTRTLHVDDAGDRTPLGPALNLPMHHQFGEYRDDFQRFPERIHDSPKAGQIATGEPAQTTPLGDLKKPPAVPGAR